VYIIASACNALMMIALCLLTRWVPRNPMGETWELYLPGHATPWGCREKNESMLVLLLFAIVESE